MATTEKKWYFLSFFFIIKILAMLIIYSIKYMFCYLSLCYITTIDSCLFDIFIVLFFLFLHLYLYSLSFFFLSVFLSCFFFLEKKVKSLNKMYCGNNAFKTFLRTCFRSIFTITDNTFKVWFYKPVEFASEVTVVFHFHCQTFPCKLFSKFAKVKNIYHKKKPKRDTALVNKLWYRNQGDKWFMWVMK